MSVFVVSLSEVVGLIVVLVIVMAYMAYGVRTFLKRLRCAHTRVYETRSCEAVCAECGLNLGFIQAWRERQKRST